MNAKTAAALATVLWGFTYVVTTLMLPPHPFLISAVRAMGGAIILLLIARQLPAPGWLGRLVILGTLNTSLFFSLLFISALRLPGGVAAIFQALGPLFIILLGWAILGARPTALKIISVIIGVVGVALVVLKGDAQVDLWGVVAALGSTLSLALGGILMNRWGRPPMSMVSFTGWQLFIAGVELTLLTVLMGDFPAELTSTHVTGFFILALALTAIPFVLWFRAIAHAGAVTIAPFFLLVPITAFTLDAIIKSVVPTPFQLLGIGIVILGLLLSQKKVPSPTAP